MFTWQAGSASDKFTLTDVSSRSFDNYTNSNQTIAGVSISQKLKNMPLEYCIAAKKNVILNLILLVFFFFNIKVLKCQVIKFLLILTFKITHNFRIIKN